MAADKAQAQDTGPSLERYSEAVNRAIDVEPAPRHNSRKGRPVVLIVDDVSLLRHVLAEVLRVRGYASLLAHNGIAALEKAEQYKVDLVTMDIDMPFMDGLQATRRIRAMGGWRAEVPIIGFSSRDDREDYRACIDAGMNTLVSKGKGMELLLDTIQRLVPSNLPAFSQDDPTLHG